MAIVATIALLVGVMTMVGAPAGPAAATGGGTVDLSEAVPATFTVTPGVEQLTITGAPPETPLTLVHDGTLERIATSYTDPQGQGVVQYVPQEFLVWNANVDPVLPTSQGSALAPGTYRVISEGIPGEPFAGPVEDSGPVTVLGVDDHPDTSLYDGQVLPSVPTKITGEVEDGHTDEEGFGYLEVRDGTLLSVNVRLPDEGIYGPGPYPTVIQYSGYSPSKPGTPSGADAGGFLANALGFAYVGVNLRGSGCSGGASDVFNAAQRADGYDVVETVARQPWVKNGRPGMMGISFSGITQLYVASTNPPSLAAITPLSVIEDPWYQQWPGGVYNSGFTQEWLARQESDAAPGGTGWVGDRIDGGDTTCEDNLSLRTQNIPFEEFARSLTVRPPDADARRIGDLVRDIDVPVYLAGAWQDEQTGARFGTMLENFDSVPPGQLKVNVYNGRHSDALTPLVISRWFEFLSFYVDTEIPKINTLVRQFSDPIFEEQFGVPGLKWEPNRFFNFGTDVPKYGDFAGSVAAYEAEDPVRVLFESGASPDFPDHPGAPNQRWTRSFSSWPPAQAEARRWYLGPDGSLVDDAPTDTRVERYAFDPDVGPTDYTVGGGDFGLPESDWKHTPDGLGLAYETAPLDDEVIVAGDGYVDLWLRSTGTDVGLEVVLSEVYEDPNPDDEVPAEEVVIQHGLLRAGYRTLDEARSTDTFKEHLFYAQDYDQLVPGELVNVQVPIYPVAHPFRPGSRLRIEINTPGGDTPRWSFENDDYGATTHDVVSGGAMASSVVLSVLPAGDPAGTIPPAFDEQAERPLCGSLRAQPCRDYVPLANEVVEADLGVTGEVTVDPVRVGDVAEVTWTVENAGDDDATGVEVETPAGPWAIGTLAAGASVQRTDEVTITEAGTTDLSAEVTAVLEGDPAPGDESATVQVTVEPACDAEAFTDVDDTNPFCDDITWLIDRGVTTGFEDGTFRPLVGTTRQGMAAFLYRDAGSPDGPTPACDAEAFTDVDETNPFCGEITWLADQGITDGFGDGSFRPQVVVSRQAMTGFLYHRAGRPLGEDPPCAEAPFTDVPVTNPFCGAITWADGAGVVEGFGDGSFGPQDPISRQAMAALLRRAAMLT